MNWMEESTLSGAAARLERKTMRAYRKAVYEVDWVTGETCSLALDKPSRILEAVFDLTGCSSSAFVTAANPFGKRLSREENAARYRALCSEIGRRGLRSLEGRGRDPMGEWPPEESRLVLGCPLKAAVELGRWFEQNAILWSERDFVPRLLVLS